MLGHHAFVALRYQDLEEVPARTDHALGEDECRLVELSGARNRTRRVTHWQSGDMALRWAASALVETAKQFRRLMGYQYLWMLETCLKNPEDQEMVAKEKKVS